MSDQEGDDAGGGRDGDMGAAWEEERKDTSHTSLSDSEILNHAVKELSSCPVLPG